MDPFRADIDVSGSGLDLAALTEGIPDLKGQISGKADLKFALKSTAQGNSGTGSVRSAAITAFGIKTTNFVFPVSLAGTALKSEGGTLDLYGGKLTNNLTFDMNSMKFSNSVNVNGVDVNALAQDASGGLGGKVTGAGSLSMKIDGSAAKKVTYSGSGQFNVGEGSITGFMGLDLLSKLYNVNGIRYTKVSAPLRLETGKLFVLKGASMTPHANDPIYRSAKLAEDGAVTFDKKIYFVAEADVNFQLINILAGGAVGGIESLVKGGGSVQNILSAQNLGSALQGAISGGAEQGKNADFRDVTVKVTGTIDSPSTSLVKVGASKQQSAEAGAAAPASPQETVKEKIIESILPTDAKSSTSAQPAKIEEVVKEKVLEKILPSAPAQQQATPKQTTPKQATPKQPTRKRAAPKQAAPKAPEKKIEEEVKGQVRKEIENLLKKN